ncbi:hypothetical protein HO173_010763 [Letharia columbiana]|uniref:Uncharacterized protein n=1 Tax=Letharia columbiana TaxID=112416 RepID=A0A8H6FM49_9LECA|nr:uncharacterized protein HO173_010763 [Letharia columbiana]KAF6231063.1 hypothetical protein HO173_010763 [Letharia columbiana]
MTEMAPSQDPRPAPVVRLNRLLSSLARSGLHLAMAVVFRRFTFELYETDVSDVRLAHDTFVPALKMDSKGVMVRVISNELSAR